MADELAMGSILGTAVAPLSLWGAEAIVYAVSGLSADARLPASLLLLSATSPLGKEKSAMVLLASEEAENRLASLAESSYISKIIVCDLGTHTVLKGGCVVLGRSYGEGVGAKLAGRLVEVARDLLDCSDTRFHHLGGLLSGKAKVRVRTGRLRLRRR